MYLPLFSGCPEGTLLMFGGLSSFSTDTKFPKLLISQPLKDFHTSIQVVDKT